jgi:DNA-binding PadR family transcriptional regulator
LAEQAALEQSTLSHILRRLEAQGHLRKERQPHDNRSVLVSLTQQGKPIAAHCWVAVQRHDVLLRQGVDAKAVELLKEVLNQLYANVPAFQQPGERPVDPAAPNEPVKDVPAAAEVRSRKPRRA